MLFHPVKADAAVLGVLGFHRHRDAVVAAQVVHAALVLHLAPCNPTTAVPQREKFGGHLMYTSLAAGLVPAVCQIQQVLKGAAPVGEAVPH